MNHKIVVLDVPLTADQKTRLSNIGELVEMGAPTSVEDFLAKTRGAEVIYSFGDFLLESLPRLKDVFVTYPYIELGAFNSEELKKNKVIVSNARGGNRDSIVEWVVYMLLALFRNFGPKVRAKSNLPFELSESLLGKQVLIVGHGDIGTRIGEVCQVVGMEVDFFDRGDDLIKKSKNVDMVINALNCNTSSKNLLDENFFLSLGKNSYFVSFARPYTYNIDGLIAAIDAGIIKGAAIDCDPEKFGDTENAFYKKAMSRDCILATPHIAFATVQASARGKEIAVQNIEAYLRDKPQNVINKK